MTLTVFALVAVHGAVEKIATFDGAEGTTYKVG
jgi:hypothetical protein